MASIRTVQPTHQQPGRRGEPASAALSDAQANYEGASRYETRLRGEGRSEGMRIASECAARVVEDMPLIGGRKKAAELIRHECS